MNWVHSKSVTNELSRHIHWFELCALCHEGLVKLDHTHACTHACDGRKQSEGEEKIVSFIVAAAHQRKKISFSTVVTILSNVHQTNRYHTCIIVTDFRIEEKEAGPIHINHRVTWHAKKHIIAERQRAQENQINISEGIPKTAAKKKRRRNETENHSN